MRKFAKSIGSGGQGAAGLVSSGVLLHMCLLLLSGDGEHSCNPLEVLGFVSPYVADPELLTKGNPTV